MIFADRHVIEGSRGRSLRLIFAAIAAMVLASIAVQPAAAQDSAVIPDSPTGLSTDVSHDLVIVSWDDPGDDSITGYVVLRRDKDMHDAGTFVTMVPDSGTTNTLYIDASIEPDKRYVYRIQAINAAGTSERSARVRANTPPAPDSAPGRPARPTGPATDVSDDLVIVSWDDPGDDSITGYVVLRRDKDIHPAGTLRTVIADTGNAGTAFSDDTVEEGRRYVYRIKAINAHGRSDTSTSVRGYTAMQSGTEDDTQSPGKPGPARRASVSEGSNDLPANASSKGRVDVGASVTGTSQNGDSDWFSVNLVSGTRYQVDLEGASTGRGTAENLLISGIRSSSHAHVNIDGTDDGQTSGVGGNARVIYTAAATQKHWVTLIAIAFNDVRSGTYTLSVIELGANGVSEADSDFASDTSTAGRVDVGASATGSIGSADDSDWLRVDLAAGTTYRFDLEGEATASGSLEDPLLTLYDPSGIRLVSDDDGGEEYNSRMTFTASAAGSYYLAAAAFAGTGSQYSLDAFPPGGTGSYTLSASETTPVPPVDPDLPGAVRNVVVGYSPLIGQQVRWDAPDETETGAQWITKFRIYSSARAGCGGYLLAEAHVAYPGFSTPPVIPATADKTSVHRFRYSKHVSVGPARFGVAAVNDSGEGPCVDGPEPPSFD
ncbi:fibronectin type III domain-containing protein [Candidatus Poriferisodalis sp.]|uniref:fibronectin type III domain-containing protein n=1 Tax=Candidatus Poriferisodalis sp. TaxID=3101277 RepID=UPI003B5A2E0C